VRAVLMQDKRLTVESVPEPVPGSGEVLVEVLYSGICGSDLHFRAHGAEFNQAAREAVGVEVMDLSRPIILGHEFVARVLAYGPGTTRRIAVGKRVTSLPALRGDRQRGIGSAGIDVPGSYAERMLLTESLLLEVPEGVPSESVSLTEPLAVALHAANSANLETCDVPLIMGCGPIGLALIAVLKMKGVAPIVAADLSPARLNLARDLGADIVVNARQHSPFEAWREAARSADPSTWAAPTPFGGQSDLRPTVAFECTGSPGVINQIIHGAPVGSRIVVAGLCMATDHFEPSQAVLKSIEMRFVAMYSDAEFEETFNLIVSGALNARGMITRTVTLEEVSGVFEQLASSPNDAKVLIDPSARTDAG
jgi:2-desacetyl-2-hydroxyethyl bacteriochlorophyllide A dehydrogenase